MVKSKDASNQVKTEARQQGAGYVDVQHGDKGAQVLGSLEHLAVLPTGHEQVPVCHHVGQGGI